MYTHHTHAHTHSYTRILQRICWVSEPSHLCSQYCVSKLLETSAVVICAVWGCRSACTDHPSPWVRNSHLTMFTENYFVHRVFQARALHQPCVATVCVSCHSVHTNLFKVPCGCCTCKNFLFPSVMCPQCPVFRVLFHCSTLIFIVPPRRPHPGPRSLIVPQHR